jgi:hypothetical protein
LAHTHTHGAQGVTATGALQLVGGGHQQAGARHAQRVAKRNGAAVRVHPGIVISNAELTQDRQALGGKGFVQLDDVNVGDADVLPL